MKKSYNYVLCYNRLARGKGKKVKFVLKTFFSALAVLVRVWRWLVSGFNCFKAAEHGGKADKNNFNETGIIKYNSTNKINNSLLKELYDKEGLLYYSTY